jgi:hypothetical protein
MTLGNMRELGVRSLDVSRPVDKMTENSWGKVRAERLSAERRAEIAKKAAESRWRKD